MPHPSGRPWIVAHRGARLVQPENTVAALRAAADQGADAVEFDVRRTADGALVVVHDPFLPGWSRPVVAMTRAELRSHAPHIPDLEEALAGCDGMWADVEIKNAPYEPDWDPQGTVARATASVIRDAGWSTRTLITSFDPTTVAAAIEEGLRGGLLAIRDADPVDMLNAVAGIEMLLPSVSAMVGHRAARVIDEAHRLSIEVGVWTVDDPAEMVRLADAGVDAICTNDPAAAVSALT